MLENEFALINIVGQGEFGRVFKMKHLKSGVMIAVKERVRNEEIYLKAWYEETKILELTQERIPHLTTSRFIGTLDDSILKEKEKYLLIEWIEGFFFLILFLLFLI